MKRIPCTMIESGNGCNESDESPLICGYSLLVARVSTISEYVSTWTFDALMIAKGWMMTEELVVRWARSVMTMNGDFK